MKILLVLVIATLAFANNLGHVFCDPITPQVNDYICSQPFNYSNISNALGFSDTNNWMIADDFIYPADGFIEYIEIWAIYTGTNPTGFNVQLMSDNSMPDEILVQASTIDVNHEDTGLYKWGYKIYFTTIVLTEPMPFYAYTKYWFALQTTGGTNQNYWICTLQTWADMTYFNNNNNWASSYATWGYAYEQFIIISGRTSLSRSTWGSIKASF
jgi:hypothetical protein